MPYRDACGKCGARRVDQQIGLEETPDQWCARLVVVFREARRVLRSDGVCWIEVGDTYNANQGSGFNVDGRGNDDSLAARVSGKRTSPAGVKPKDLVGAPWLLAFALRADGWYLRSDTIWARPNPMPESVTDRPTKAHSYVFLLTKQARYYFDSDAIREPHQPDGRKVTTVVKGENSEQHRNGERWPGTGRNARSVQTWATQPTPFQHFATFPEALVAWCIRAGTSEHGSCGECGAPWRRITERRTPDDPGRNGKRHDADGTLDRGQAKRQLGGNYQKQLDANPPQTTGWEPSCAHDAPVTPCLVLDCFMGSGTTALVARRLGRHAIGIELNAEYLAISATRLQQLSLLGGHA